ncbi:MAG: hypothetical protein ABID38_07060 [Candidatus Diapherotrites archaeon]
MLIERRPLRGNKNSEFYGQWMDYYPFSDAADTREIYRGKGIAQLLEYMVLLEMKKQYPNTKFIKHHWGPDSTRIKQMEKRDLEPGNQYPIDQEIRLLKAKIAKNAKSKWPLHKRVKSKLKKLGKKIMRK